MKIINPYCRNGGNHFVEINWFTGKRGGTLHALACYLAMTRLYMKAGVVSLLTFVLFYYGVAWAVLICFHEDDNDHHPAVVSVPDLPGVNNYLLSPCHGQVNVDCLDANYHTEALAGPSSLIQHPTRVALSVSHVIDDVTLTVAAARARWLWLKTVFDRIPSTAILINLPRYLSLAVLRI